LDCRQEYTGGPQLKSTHSAAYRRMLDLLIQARKTSGLTQQDLAAKLGRPQSFVSKVELGERRLDVFELLEFCRIVHLDPHELLREIEADQ
jgi:transcriptional regulator with XRE-family HTH domain